MAYFRIGHKPTVFEKAANYTSSVILESCKQSKKDAAAIRDAALTYIKFSTLPERTAEELGCSATRLILRGVGASTILKAGMVAGKGVAAASLLKVAVAVSLFALAHDLIVVSNGMLKSGWNSTLESSTIRVVLRGTIVIRRAFDLGDRLALSLLERGID